MSQVTLENLLFIATESPKDGFDDKLYEYFVDELSCRNPKMSKILLDLDVFYCTIVCLLGGIM